MENFQTIPFDTTDLTANELLFIEGGKGGKNFWIGIAGAALYDFIDGFIDGVIEEY
jgi:hypothetical protein